MSHDVKHDAWEKLIENIEEMQLRIDEEIERAENNFISHDEDIDWNNPNEAGYIEAVVELKNEEHTDYEGSTLRGRWSLMLTYIG